GLDLSGSGSELNRDDVEDARCLAVRPGADDGSAVAGRLRRKAVEGPVPRRPELDRFRLRIVLEPRAERARLPVEGSLEAVAERRRVPDRESRRVGHHARGGDAVVIANGVDERLRGARELRPRRRLCPDLVARDRDARPAEVAILIQRIDEAGVTAFGGAV